MNKIKNILHKLDTFGKSESCNNCNNKNTSMCDCCSNFRFAIGEKENHHTDNYLDINFEPKFLEYDFNKRR